MRHRSFLYPLLGQALPEEALPVDIAKLVSALRTALSLRVSAGGERTCSLGVYYLPNVEHTERDFDRGGGPYTEHRWLRYRVQLRLRRNMQDIVLLDMEQQIATIHDSTDAGESVQVPSHAEWEEVDWTRHKWEMTASDVIGCVAVLLGVVARA